MSITAYERDISAQPDVLRTVHARYSGEDRVLLDAAAELAASGSQVLFAGMGSSLVAGYPAADTLMPYLPARACDAGELLHYGWAGIGADATVVLVSQSGRSVETLKLAERLLALGHERLVAVTNDPDSPLMGLAAVGLPIHAGAEATVSTKTFVTTFAVLGLLARSIVRRLAPSASSGPSLDQAMSPFALVAERSDLADDAAEAMRDCVALCVVGRGPCASAASYGALITKETVSLPAEAFTGGAFRHGPIEMCGPQVGVVVMAPSGPTRTLAINLALETGGCGSPTWLLADDTADLPSETDRLRVTTLPAVDEAYAPLIMSVPIQRLAAALARQRGRVPGILLRSSKVTVVE